MKSILTAVNYLHVNNIIHRDLNFDNLFVEIRSKNSIVKIGNLNKACHYYDMIVDNKLITRPN